MDVTLKGSAKSKLLLLLLLFLKTAASLLLASSSAVVSPSRLDLIKVEETSQPIKCSTANHSQLLPESRIVGVYFGDSIEKDLKPVNGTKQSQDFEINQPPAVAVPSTTSTPATENNGASSGHGSTSSSTSTSTTYEPQTTEINPILVASETVRQGGSISCGEANPSGKSNKKLVMERIVGGRKTEPGEFPFQVRLNIRSRRGSGICGGVIIGERHILTAAHCMTACVSQYLTTATIEASSVHATIGDHSIKSNDGEIEIDVEKIVPHEKYDACNFYANDHDIALVITSKPIQYRFTSDGYGSINRPCMPSPLEATYKEGESVIVSGWGVTRENSGALSNILRYVQVPLVQTLKCQETYGSRVSNDHICAGYQSGGKDSCQGDSGGPLVRVLENRYELVGIVSFGYGCGQPGAPGVYTRVASYIDWIKNASASADTTNQKIW